MKYLVLALVCACSFRTHDAAGTDAAGGDGAPGDALNCQYSSQTDTCALGVPGNDLVLSGSNSYDTDTGLLNGSAAPHMRLTGQEGPFDAIIVRDFHMTLGASLRATGSLPFAVIAYGSITLDATTVLDVGVGGAGARTSCDMGAVAGQDESGGAAGGGGGGFGSAGGSGGDGNSDGNHSTGGAGGAAAATAPKGPLGGCPGAHGGKGEVDGGAGGAAGGAVYLVARVQLTLASSAGIQAGGGGGGPGLVDTGYGDTGGGGGGAGGMIFLESPIVHALGVLAANGGGGGEASGNGEAGMPGEDAILGTAAAGGGHGLSSTGTDGGNGGAGTGAAVSVTNVQAGGGGGGGGSVGYVIVRAPDQQLGTASPPAQ